MRALFCAAVFISCLAPAFAETRTPSSPITIVYRFDAPASEFVFGEIKDQIQTLMEPSSLRPQWHSRSELTAADSFENLIVVDFHGRCRTGPNDSAVKEDQPLGRARVVDGEVLPFIEIECGRVQASLRTALLRQNQNPDVTLGRALARVLAHELYHVLAGTTSHSRAGIAKPSLTSYDLLSTRLDFTPADVDRMKSPQDRSSLAHLAQQGLAFVP